MFFFSETYDFGTGYFMNVKCSTNDNVKLHVTISIGKSNGKP